MLYSMLRIVSHSIIRIAHWCCHTTWYALLIYCYIFYLSNSNWMFLLHVGKSVYRCCFLNNRLNNCQLAHRSVPQKFLFSGIIIFSQYFKPSMTVLSARDKQTERQRENITYFDIRRGYFISFII